MILQSAKKKKIVEKYRKKKKNAVEIRLSSFNIFYTNKF